MQLALFTDKKLSQKEEDKVFEHLAQCKRCRDVLKLANKLEDEDKKQLPVNNPSYKGMLKHFIPLAAGLVIVLGIPQGNKYLNPEPSMKGTFVDKNIFEESIDFWENVYKKLFKG